MPRYFLEIAYDGTAYHGWQVQPNAITVQSVLEERLSMLLRSKVETVGCGRTDTGVHAQRFFLHFDLPEALPPERDLLHQLNRVLPEDIAANSLQAVEATAHARFDAVQREYHYRVTHVKDPFLRQYACYLPYRPDYARMNGAATTLMGTHDFSCFSKAHTQTQTNQCTLTRAEWVATGEDNYTFIISADRFLRNMVRAVVGTLLEVGQGRMTDEEFNEVLVNGSRQDAGVSMPAHGLSLVDVRYPYIPERRGRG